MKIELRKVTLEMREESDAEGFLSWNLTYDCDDCSIGRYRCLDMDDCPEKVPSPPTDTDDVPPWISDKDS